MLADYGGKDLWKKVSFESGMSETGQGYSLWSEELQFTFVNCLQIIHKFKHEHEKEYSLHVVGAVGPLTMSCIGDTDSNKQQS